MNRLEKFIYDFERECPAKLVTATRRTLAVIKKNNADWSYLDEILFWQHTEIAYLYGYRKASQRRVA